MRLTPYSDKIKREMRREKKLSTFDKILAYYLDKKGKVRLTPVQEQQRLRYEKAFSLMCNYHSKEQVVPVLRKEFDISQAQAYQDVNESMRLFGDVNKSNKEGLKHILTEYSMKVFQIAAKDGELGEMNKAISNIIKIHGLAADDAGEFDWSKYVPTLVIINSDPETLKKQAQELVQDIDFDDV